MDWIFRGSCNAIRTVGPTLHRRGRDAPGNLEGAPPNTSSDPLRRCGMGDHRPDARLPHRDGSRCHVNDGPRQIDRAASARRGSAQLALRVAPDNGGKAITSCSKRSELLELIEQMEVGQLTG